MRPPSAGRRHAYSAVLALPLLVAAKEPVPKGDLLLDTSAPVIVAEINGAKLRLRVDLGQWQTIELNAAAAARLALLLEPGHDAEIGTITLPGQVAAGLLVVAGAKRPVTLAVHAGAPSIGDADGVIGPDLLPYASIDWRRADAPMPSGVTTLALENDDTTGLAAIDAGVPGGLALHFTLGLPTSFATGAAGSRLAELYGGRFDGPAAPLAAPFGRTRPARPLLLARPPLLAGFRFERIAVRAADFRGHNKLPADPIAPDAAIVVAKRVPPQHAEAWVTIAADRLMRCADITYRAVPPTLTLHCASDWLVR